MRSAAAKTCTLLGQLSAVELRKHNGLHLEKLTGLIDPESGEPIYSIRVTIAARLLVLLREETLTLLELHTDHDKAYRRN